MGCGISGSYVVCQYDPSGNNLGFELNGETNFAENVLPLNESAACHNSNQDETPDEQDEEIIIPDEDDQEN